MAGADAMGKLDTATAQHVLHQMHPFWRGAAQGDKGNIVQATAAQLSCSAAAVYARFAGMNLHTPAHKRRADAGQSALSLAEARQVSAYLRSTDRLTGKMLADVEAALETLRHGGEICAGKVNPATGEIAFLSASAVLKAMRKYGCHTTQLRTPPPRVAMSTPRPNALWEIDPSLCVLYYLRGQQGMCAMPQAEFYKNKPQNVERIVNERVWRYVFTCHTTNAWYVEYVLGAESGPNLCATFINAMQPKGAADPFCGVPVEVMLDPGSANTGAMFQSLCAALSVRVRINRPHQPQVKGTVEKSNDIIEREFEHRLAFYRVNSLEELNAAVQRWSQTYQATKEHSRHGMTRFDAWMKITPAQLRFPPAPDVCRALSQHAPTERTVDSFLRVSFGGKAWVLRDMPGVSVGDKVKVSRSAWSAECIHVQCVDADGQPMIFAAPLANVDDWGFIDAVPVGQYRAMPTTPADVERAAVERVAMDATTNEEAAEKRKKKALPFGGRLDPFKPVTERPAPSYIPRRGRASEVQAPAIAQPSVTAPALPAPPPYVAPLLTHTDMARGLKWRIEERGGAWGADLYSRMAAMWPDGVTEDKLDECAVALLRGGLRIAGGAA